MATYASSAASGSAASGTPIDRVNAAFAAWDATFDKGDATALAAFYLPDAYVLPPTHQVVQGNAAIVKFFTGQFAAGVTGHVLVPFDVVVAGDSLIASSNWSAHGPDHNGKPVMYGGLATHVLQEQADGSLKLRIHIFN